VTTRAFAVDVGDKSRPIIASGLSGRLTDMPQGYEFGGYCCPVAGIRPWICCRSMSAICRSHGHWGYGEMVTLIGGEIGTRRQLDRQAAKCSAISGAVSTVTPSDQFER
jgi:hypothetical protein